LRRALSGLLALPSGPSPRDRFAPQLADSGVPVAGALGFGGLLVWQHQRLVKRDAGPGCLVSLDNGWRVSGGNHPAPAFLLQGYRHAKGRPDGSDPGPGTPPCVRPFHPPVPDAVPRDEQGVFAAVPALAGAPGDAASARTRRPKTVHDGLLPGLLAEHDPR